MKRTRVICTCVKCREDFRYNYPGSGPYRSVCNKCLSKAALAMRKARASA